MLELFRTGPGERLVETDRCHVEANAILDQQFVPGSLPDGALDGCQASVARQSFDVRSHPLLDTAEKLRLGGGPKVFPGPQKQGQKRHKRQSHDFLSGF